MAYKVWLLIGGHIYTYPYWKLLKFRTSYTLVVIFISHFCIDFSDKLVL